MATITPNFRDASATGLSIIPVQTVAKGNTVSGFLDLLNSSSTQAALSAIVSAGGSGYAVGDTITLAGGTASGSPDGRGNVAGQDATNLLSVCEAVVNLFEANANEVLLQVAKYKVNTLNF